MRILWLLTVLFAFAFQAKGQTLRGKVLDKATNEPLVGASVFWLNTNTGTMTDTSGHFKISLANITEKKLVVSSFGYSSDTIEITNQDFLNVTLIDEAQALVEIVISTKGKENPIKTEVITKTDLKKSACCDLAGCFETQATVQPTTTNIITNSKELRILGLSGVYNQVLIDGMPLIQGLSYTYGISSFPGTLVDNIYVSKGTTSVLQGFESISGQINVVLKEPVRAEKLLVNVYTNSFFEKHLNFNYSKRFGKWSTLAVFHTVQPANKFDRDKDTFLDLPKLTRYSFYNKWKYRDEDSLGLSSIIGVRYLDEKRIGGQTNFDPERDKGSNKVYGQSVNLQQPEIYTKTGFRFNDRNKITFISSSFHQRQRSFYGTTIYNADQTNLYANLQHELTWSGRHELKTGISYRYANLNENISFSYNDLI